MKNIKLSFPTVFSINAITVVISMIVAKYYHRGVFNSSHDGIEIVKNLFLAQLIINLVLLVWPFRSAYNRQLVIVNIIALVIFWLVMFLICFVTVN